MKNVLFVSQPKHDSCGVAFAGNIWADTLIKSTDYNFIVLHASSPIQVNRKVKEINPSAIIYNYHKRTMPWVDNKLFRKKQKNIPCLKIHYDITQKIIDNFNPKDHGGFKYIITNDPTLNGNDNVFVTTRLIPPYYPLPYIEREIPIIGFQGFGAPFKGILRLAHKVQEEFDEAILRLHIPPGTYGSDITEAVKRVNEVKVIITKPGIKIEASHEILSSQNLVAMMSQNTINCYFYDFLDGAGIASSPDYALAAKRPIAVTKSHMLRNLWSLTPSICIEDNSLKDIISFGLEPLKPLYEAYTEERLLQDYKGVLDRVIG